MGKARSDVAKWRGQGWAAERRERFLEELGEAGNVRLAARAAGYSCARDAYRLREADPCVRGWMPLQLGACRPREGRAGRAGGFAL
jgi:hypothetical protein